MIPLPPESVRAVAAGDEVEVFVPLDVQPESNTTKYAMQYGKVPTRWRLRNKYGDGFVFAHHPLGEPGTVHGVGEEWRKMTPLRDGDLQAVYFPDGEITYNPAFDDHRVHTVVPIINQHADTIPYWAVRHRVQTTRLGPIEQRDGVWGGVGWVRKVEG